MTAPPLDGLRVVDLSSWIAGAYATKLLADGGAEVVKVESPEGDPLRRWSASGAEIPPGEDAALFNHLACSKRSVVVDPDDLAALDDLLAGTDVVVWSPGPLDLAPSAIRDAHPHLVVTAITPFGLDGPWSDRPATELTLQAWSGGLIRIARGYPDLPPTFVGGQVGEWLTGTFAAVGSLAAWRRSGGDAGDLVDVSMLECLAGCLTYEPVTFFDQRGEPIRKDRFVPTPGVAQAKDGLVGLGTGTGQQFHDFAAMVGHPEWIEDRSLLAERSHLKPEIDAWVAERTVDEVLDLASAFRLPNAPIANGATAPGIGHLRERGAFVANPKDGVLNPAPPVRFESVRLRERTPAPSLGEHVLAPDSRAPATESGARSSGRALPFEGLRALDMTAFWAGPMTGHLLAFLGAEVVHLESPTRPDGVRYVGGVPPSEDQHLERSAIFSALNTDKLGLAIDLTDPRGVEVLQRFVRTCDVVVENYTPRVFDRLGLEAHPGLITVRMPGFGLDGPWRAVAAFAFVIEDASGLTWLSGHPEVPPIEPYSIGDPNAGLHALYGLQLALEHRDRTGEGGLVEAAMLDAALNIAAEQVIEHSAHGALLTREGNRGPTAAPQNVYRVTGRDEYDLDDRWVAISVATDDQWEALRTALGDPEWARDEAYSSADGRRAAHDTLDEHLAAWCATRSADEVVATLWPAGVPVGDVVQPHHQADIPPFRHRGYFEALTHPVIGESRYATLPMRFSNGPDRWHHRPAPLLGQHTTELLLDAGLSEDEIEKLAADGVVA